MEKTQMISDGMIVPGAGNLRASINLKTAVTAMVSKQSVFITGQVAAPSQWLYAHRLYSCSPGGIGNALARHYHAAGNGVPTWLCKWYAH